MGGHSSPRHQHGGCAGSVRIVHGVLDIKLYQNVFTTRPMSFSNGEGGLSIPEGEEREVLVLRRENTTWLNRNHWFCHEVTCSDAHEINQSSGFAASLHV